MHAIKKIFWTDRGRARGPKNLMFLTIIIISIAILGYISQYVFILEDQYADCRNHSNEASELFAPEFSREKTKKLVVLFDEGHIPTYTTSTKNPSYDGTGTTGGGGYGTFAESIKNEFDADIRTLDATTKYAEYRRINEGLHWVSKGGEMNSTVLSGVDLLIIPASIGGYTPSELDEIRLFVKNGGSLLVTGEAPPSSTGFGTYAFGAESVIEKFGMKIGGTLRDYSTCMRFKEDGSDVVDFDYLQFNSTQMSKHRITDGVSLIEFFRGWYFLFPPYGSVPLLYSSPYALPSNSPVALAIPAGRTIGEGRIVVVGDGGMFKDYMVGGWGNDGDEDHDGTVDFNDANNRIFAMNIIKWLTKYDDFSIYFAETETPETYEKTIGPNQTVEYPIKLKNIGHDTDSDTIDFNVEGIPAGWLFELMKGAENISSVSLRAGEEADLTLSITTPDEMINTTVTTILSGKSRNDANASHNITAITNLHIEYNVTIAPSEEQISVLPGNAARYFLNITNSGTIVDEFQLKIDNETNAYAVIEGGLNDFLVLPSQTVILKLFVVPKIHTPPTKICTTVKIESKRNFGNISVCLATIVEPHHIIDTTYYVHPYEKNDSSASLTITLTNKGNMRENAELNISTDPPASNLSVQNTIDLGSSINIPFVIIQPPSGETSNIYLNTSYENNCSTITIPIASTKVGATARVYNANLFVAKGTLLDIPVFIGNIGNLKDTFVLSASGEFTNWSIRNEESNIVSLDPISSKIIHIDVCIPIDADIAISLLWINVTSQINQEIAISIPVYIAVKPVLELSNIRMDRKTIKNGEDVQITADAKNWKNEKINATVYFIIDGDVLESRHLNEFENSTQLFFHWTAKDGEYRIEVKGDIDGADTGVALNASGHVNVESALILQNHTLLFLVIIIIASICTAVAIRRWEK